MPLLWNFVVGELLVTLKTVSYNTQGHTDDIAKLLMEKSASTILELMQKALKTTGWSRQQTLTGNSTIATLVPFMRRRNQYNSVKTQMELTS